MLARVLFFGYRVLFMPQIRFRADTWLDTWGSRLGPRTHLVGIEDRKHARSMIKMVRCVDALADMEPETNTVRLFLEDGASLDRATVWCGRTGDVH